MSVKDSVIDFSSLQELIPDRAPNRAKGGSSHIADNVISGCYFNAEKNCSDWASED